MIGYQAATHAAFMEAQWRIGQENGLLLGQGRDVRCETKVAYSVSTNVQPKVSFLNVLTYCMHIPALALVHNTCPASQDNIQAQLPAKPKTKVWIHTLRAPHLSGEVQVTPSENALTPWSFGAIPGQITKVSANHPTTKRSCKHMG